MIAWEESGGSTGATSKARPGSERDLMSRCDISEPQKGNPPSSRATLNLESIKLKVDFES